MREPKFPGQWRRHSRAKSTYNRTSMNTPKRKKFKKEFYKKVLVTGGLGFIGSYVAEAFASHQHEVTVIDNMQNNAIDPEFWKNDNGFIDVFNVSIDEFLSDKSILPRFDIVCHLAAPVGPVGVLKYAGDMAKQIIDDTVGLRDYCIDTGALFMNISTSEVYGHAGKLKEESEKIFPGIYQVRTEYGASKMVAEIAIINKARVDDRLKYHIIRPFNVAGARQQPDGGFVLPRFILQALRKEPLTVYGDGNQRRGFTDARDIAEGIYRIAMNKKDIVNEIWNIGNPNNAISINRLASMVIHEVLDGKDEPWNIKPIDPVELHGKLFSEVPEKVPYIVKLHKHLRWKPTIPILQIIKHTIAYWKEKI